MSEQPRPEDQPTLPEPKVSGSSPLPEEPVLGSSASAEKSTDTTPPRPEPTPPPRREDVPFAATPGGQKYQQTPPPPQGTPPHQQQDYHQQPPKPHYAPQQQGKSKVAAGLLGILLGSLGVHNFYLGYHGKAIAQLLITLLSLGFLAFASAIWGLIEGILILVSKPGEKWNVDADGVPLSG